MELACPLLQRGVACCQTTGLLGQLQNLVHLVDTSLDGADNTKNTGYSVAKGIQFSKQVQLLSQLLWPVSCERLYEDISKISVASCFPIQYDLAFSVCAVIVSLGHKRSSPSVFAHLLKICFEIWNYLSWSLELSMTVKFYHDTVNVLKTTIYKVFHTKCVYVIINNDISKQLQNSIQFRNAGEFWRTRSFTTEADYYKYQHESFDEYETRL